MSDSARLIPAAVPLLLFAGMWMLPQSVGAQVAAGPEQPPRLAIRNVSWGDGHAHTGTMVDELNQGLEDLRRGLKAVRLDLGLNVENELDRLLLFQFSSRWSLKYRLREQSQEYEDSAQAKDGDFAAETLLSQVVNDTIFNPETGLYRGLLVEKISVDHQLQQIIVELRAPSGWAGYEITRIATYALRIKASTCESIVGLRAPALVGSVADSRGRVVKLSFNPSTVSDLLTADDLAKRSDVIFVARYARTASNPAAHSNAPYANTQGEEILCAPPPPKAGTP